MNSSEAAAGDGGMFSFEGESCPVCKGILGDSYYRKASWKLCTSCAEKTKADEAANSASAYTRALVYGAAAAVLGCILYALFIILTKFEIGIMAIAVAWLVVTAMRKAANGCGGHRYQITAAILIYAAVSTSAVPVFLVLRS